MSIAMELNHWPRSVGAPCTCGSYGAVTNMRLGYKHIAPTEQREGKVQKLRVTGALVLQAQVLPGRVLCRPDAYGCNR